MPQRANVIMPHLNEWEASVPGSRVELQTNKHAIATSCFQLAFGLLTTFAFYLYAMASSNTKMVRNNNNNNNNN